MRPVVQRENGSLPTHPKGNQMSATKRKTATEAEMHILTGLRHESQQDAENRIVGEWIIGEQQSGALTVDLRRLDDVRSGVRLALAAR
jgi:hypothetical protein